VSIVLLSIKPGFAEEILSGNKRFELRAGSGIPSGARVILYVSSPVKAIIGEFTAGRVFTGSYEYVVKVVSGTPCSGVSEEDYGYIRGRKRRVMAIEVLNPMRYCKYVSLGELRLVGLKNPPRSYQFLHLENPVHMAVLELVDRARECRL
jgi:predicted transcriptional regulator